MTTTQIIRVALLSGLAWAVSHFIAPWLIGNAMAFLHRATGEIMDPLLGAMLYNFLLGPAAVAVTAGYITVVQLRSIPGIHSLPSRNIITATIIALSLSAIAIIPASRLFPRYTYWQQSEAGITPTVGITSVLLPAFGDGFFAWAFPGILIGYAIASEIKAQGMRLAGKQTALIVAGWGVGFALGGGLWLAGIDGLSIQTARMDMLSQVVTGLVMNLPYAILGFIGGLTGMWFTLQALTVPGTLPNPV